MVRGRGEPGGPLRRPSRGIRTVRIDTGESVLGCLEGNPHSSAEDRNRQRQPLRGLTPRARSGVSSNGGSATLSSPVLTGLNDPAMIEHAFVAGATTSEVEEEAMVCVWFPQRL